MGFGVYTFCQFFFNKPLFNSHLQYSKNHGATLKYLQTNLIIYNPLNIHNKLFIKINLSNLESSWK